MLQDILLVVGPYGDWVNFDLDQKVQLVQEIDGELPITLQGFCERQTKNSASWPAD